MPEQRPERATHANGQPSHASPFRDAKFDQGVPFGTLCRQRTIDDNGLPPSEQWWSWPRYSICLTTQPPTS